MINSSVENEKSHRAKLNLDKVSHKRSDHKRRPKMNYEPIFNQLNDLLNMIGGIDGMNQILRGNAKVVIVRHIVNSTINPAKNMESYDWEIEKHNGEGEFELDPSRLKLYVSEEQRNGKYITGSNLRKELEGNKDLVLMNACVLDYLLAHPDIIPESWKTDGKGEAPCICFWGTIYLRSGGDLVVQYLRWCGAGWYRSYHYVSHTHWSSRHPAAILAPPRL